MKKCVQRTLGCIVLLTLLKLVDGQPCSSDLQCNLPERPVCDFRSWTCQTEYARNCTTNAQCMSQLLHCNSTSNVCSPVYCTNNVECQAENTNTTCKSGKCACIDGFGELNGRCSKVLGRVCIETIDCNAEYAICSDGKCICDTTRSYEINEVCLNLVGKSCNKWSDCHTSYTTACYNGVCDCKPGFVLKDGWCQQVLYRTCSNNTDCPLEHAYCPTSYSSCRCQPGYTGSATCNQILGSHCDETQCYNYQNGNDEYGYVCNEDNSCVCGKGFMADDHQETCIPVFGRNCNSSNDCGSRREFRCESGTCICAEHFVQQSLQWSNYGQVTRCIPELGQYCYGTCTVEHAVCTQGVCDCLDGYFENYGTCSPVLGNPCARDLTCQVLNNTRCGLQGQCECKSGFKPSGVVCVKVLGSSCNTDADCSAANAFCSPSRICVCGTDFPEYDNRCLRPDCHVHVPVLPDLHRRAKSYTRRSNEPLLQDTSLAERWYSIGIYRLCSVSDSPSINRGGTTYPIYLKATLTETQLQGMKTGNITVRVKVGNVSLEEIDIMLRICGDEQQAYMRPPKTQYAAYCIETANFTMSSTYVYSAVQSTLNFYENTLNNISTNVPYILFKCDINYGAYRSVYYNGFYFAVHWYVNGNYLTTIGPVPSRNEQKLMLSEFYLIQAGFKAGINLQCSMELFESLSTLKSSQTFTDAFLTGINVDYWLNIYQESLLNIYYSTPLGCATPVGDQSMNCSIKFDLVDDNGIALCAPTVTESDKHPMCGVSLTGISKTGQQRGYTNHEHQYSYYKNGFYVQVYEQIGAKILTKEPTDRGRYLLKVKFKRNSDGTGHQFWNNYNFPDVLISITQPDIVMPWEYCYSNWEMRDYPTVSKSYWSMKNSFNPIEIDIDAAGEYWVFRSKVFPVAIQAKFENCSDEAGIRKICFCAFTYRDGNDIYSDYHCEGVHKVGYIYGIKTSTGYMNFNTIQGLSAYSYITSVNMYWGINIWNYDTLLADGEGLCSFRSNKFQKRDGTVSSTSNGFVNSWRVSPGESLLNTTNHIQYAWNDTYYTCACPTSKYVLPNMSIINQGDLQETHHLFTGVMNCTLDKMCASVNGGKVWTPSLLPDYAITNIIVSVGMVYFARNPVLQFKCNFKVVDGYLYNLQWKVNDKVVLATNFSSAATIRSAFLTDDYLNDEDNPQFILDADIVCGVSVFKSKTELVQSTVYSDVFKPVQIETKAINLLRGWDATITLTKNIPFGCQSGKECDIEFTLYDPDDSYDCRDSTIAVKSKTTCGKQIKGATSSQDIRGDREVIDIMITTKNNNKYSLRNTYSLKLKATFHGTDRRIFSGEFKDPVTVFVRDDTSWQGNYCYSSNDPRMKTFDGVYYSNQNIDEFIMMRHKVLPVEIQMKTTLCNLGWAACTCGVTVRAGRDIFTVNHCNGDHITGYLLDDERILSVRQRTANRYEITLPHGTLVDVQISTSTWYMVNVNIYPSPADVGNVVGLCGNVNGNYSDDFTHRNGVVESAYPYAYYSPDAFSQSWGLNHMDKWNNESLLNPSLYKSFGSWVDQQQQLCVCPGNSNVSMCSANEDDTCTVPVNKPGKKLEIEKRKERSAEFLNREYEKRLQQLHLKSLVRSKVKRSVNPYAISELEALSRCNDSMTKNCPLFTIIAETNITAADGLLQDCSRDLAINPDVNWPSEACARLQGIVEIEIRKDTSFQENAPDIVSLIAAQNCVGNCTGHGLCDNGTCICYQPYDSSDCSIDSSALLEIETIHGDGVCDRKTDGDCYCIRMTTNGNLESVTCQISIRNADRDGHFKNESSQITAAIVENYNELFCCVPQTTRRKRSTVAGYTSIAQYYGFAVSNNGINFGSPRYIFVLDSTCQEILNVTTSDYVAVLKSGYCFINGVCYPDGTKQDCQICRSNQDLFDWKDDGCVATEETTTSKNLTVIIAVVVTVTAIIAILVTVVCVLHKYKAQRMLAPEIGRDVTNISVPMPQNAKFHWRNDLPDKIQ